MLVGLPGACPVIGGQEEHVRVAAEPSGSFGLLVEGLGMALRQLVGRDRDAIASRRASPTDGSEVGRAGELSEVAYPAGELLPQPRVLALGGLPGHVTSGIASNSPSL